MSQKIVTTFEVSVPDTWDDTQVEMLESALTDAAQAAADKVVDEHDDLQPAFGFVTDVVLER